MNVKMKSKFFTAIVVTLAVLAVMVANASAEDAWAQSVVSYGFPWSNTDNILGASDDAYAVGYGRFWNRNSRRYGQDV